MKASTLGIVLVVAVANAASCKPPKPPRPPIVNEITALSIQIREWRREAKLPVDPRREDVLAIAPKTIAEARHVCPASHAVPNSCGDVCSLADAICDNAEQICLLADELGKDDKWAQEKCDSAKASCRDAKKLCCQCSETDDKASATW